MKILFTGASSFTGRWFSKELVKEGHEVMAIFQKPAENYEGLRKERVLDVLTSCESVFNCPFGSDHFLDVLEGESGWDIFCHHAADAGNYKSPDFDFAKALENNTKNIKTVLASLQKKGCQRILLTGSVFAQNEGSGTDNLRAVSPYGLSKGLTSDVFRFFTAAMHMKLGKFVIPNPFGPYEEFRFTAYLAHSWFEKKMPTISTPAYVRDNIHVSLLTRAYVNFAEQLTENFAACYPSGYCETQGDFTRRFSREMEKRFAFRCPFTLNEQNLFSEPEVRVNTDQLDHRALHWEETQAWDQLAVYYKERYGS